MDMATAVVLIVAIVIFSELYRCRIREKGQALKKLFDEMTKQIVSLEKRMANLETITLENENEKRFTDLSFP